MFILRHRFQNFVVRAIIFRSYIYTHLFLIFLPLLFKNLWHLFALYFYKIDMTYLVRQIQRLCIQSTHISISISSRVRHHQSISAILLVQVKTFRCRSVCRERVQPFSFEVDGICQHELCVCAYLTFVHQARNETGCFIADPRVDHMRCFLAVLEIDAGHICHEILLEAVLVLGQDRLFAWQEESVGEVEDVGRFLELKMKIYALGSFFFKWITYEIEKEQKQKF